MGDFRSFAAPN